jgi:hypothetical protein
VVTVDRQVWEHEQTEERQTENEKPPGSTEPAAPGTLGLARGRGARRFEETVVILVLPPLAAHVIAIGDAHESNVGRTAAQRYPS